jgi:hypothetical protein
MAFQSAEGISVAKAEVESTTGTATTQALTVTDGSSTNFVVQEDGKVGVGCTPTAATVEIDGGSSGSLKVGNGTQAVRLYADADEATVLADGAVDMRFYTNGSEKMRLDTSGRVGIGTASPGGLSAAANNLVVGSGSGNEGLTIFSASDGEASIYFADGTTGNEAYRSYIVCQHASDNLVFGTAGANRWTINSSGNLVANGTAIDFGSTNTTTGVTVTGSTLDHYEEGTWTVTNDGDATGVINASDATYTRIGNIVTVRATFTVTTNFTSNKIGGLPYLPATNSISNSTSGTPVMTLSATSSPIIAHVLGNTDTVRFTSGTNLGTTHALNTTHLSYRVFLSYNV